MTCPIRVDAGWFNSPKPPGDRDPECSSRISFYSRSPLHPPHLSRIGALHGDSEAQQRHVVGVRYKTVRTRRCCLTPSNHRTIVLAFSRLQHVQMSSFFCFGNCSGFKRGPLQGRAFCRNFFVASDGV